MAAGHFESGADVSSTFLGFVVGVGAWPQQSGVVEMHPGVVGQLQCGAQAGAVRATARTMVSIGDQVDLIALTRLAWRPEMRNRMRSRLSTDNDSEVNVDEIRSIAVVGAGLIGHGIAQEFALAGYAVHRTI